VETDSSFKFFQSGTTKSYQTDYLSPSMTIAPGATSETTTRLFAGAKEVRIVDGYSDGLKIDRFDRLIDWGWFYFITKPMFVVIDWIFRQTGNFGIAILLVTVLIKAGVLPARQQVLRLDGEDEEGAAGDDGAARALRRRQDEAAAGADGALQAREDQSAVAGCCRS
jgi:membrane protein insertase Oxa1/YidC/SpoIIIJ